MSKDIKINFTQVEVPVTIEVNGVKYPRTRHNIDVVMEWVETKDDAVLDKLSEVSLVF